MNKKASNRSFPIIKLVFLWCWWCRLDSAQIIWETIKGEKKLLPWVNWWKIRSKPIKPCSKDADEHSNWQRCVLKSKSITHRWFCCRRDAGEYSRSMAWNILLNIDRSLLSSFTPTELITGFNLIPLAFSTYYLLARWLLLLLLFSPSTRFSPLLRFGFDYR